MRYATRVSMGVSRLFYHSVPSDSGYQKAMRIISTQEISPLSTAD